MKNKSYRLFISVFFLTLIGLPACKNKDLDVDSFEIEREKVVSTADSVRITGSYSFAGTVKRMKVNIGEKESLIEANAYEMQMEGTEFSVSVGGLKPSTEYYYRYSIDFGTNDAHLTETKSFTTLDAVPTVKTLEVLAIDSTTFRIKCEVVSDGGQEVTERGICFNNYGDPTMDDETIQHASGGLGIYTIRMENLTSSTVYYVRAYAKSATSISFGEELNFQTSGSTSLPKVSTVEISNVTNNTAQCLGNVSSDGGLEITERGVCWSTSHNPTIDGSHGSSGSGLGTFTVELTDLAPGTTYYVRAYATNSAGTAYGSEKTLTTEANLPTVTTGEVTNIGQNTAQGSGNVTNDGSATVTERGVCWGTSHNPTISGSHATSGTSTGTFTVNMTGLTANTHYYVRAYAKNSAGISYGNEVDFTTSQNISAPTVTTSQVTNVTQTTATGGGNVTSDGGATVTERGICWSTSHNPTTSGSHATSGTGTGSYTVNMTGLTAGITYYVRAYAINSAGTSYGSEVSFTTQQAVTIPTVTTSQVTNITQTSAKGGGNVTSDGGATVTERGICWSTSHNPTTSGSHAYNGIGTGSYTVNMTGLTSGTTYFVRAYAVNSQGTAYSSEVSFTTLSSGGSHEYVDLGLPSGTKWATCNVGANAPEEYGDYFAWGETQPKDIYDWSTYQYCMGDQYMLTKYCTDASCGYNGFVDNLTTLLAEDDAATANWGSGWRMPTDEECNELYQNTTVTLTTQNGVNGRLFTAANGNSLFLPAAGYRDGGSLGRTGDYGLFWSGSLYTDNPSSAWFFYFISNDFGMNGDHRYYGQSVRPVRSSGQN